MRRDEGFDEGSGGPKLDRERESKAASEEALARLLEKMVEVSGSLDAIERWLEGETPRELALGLANDFSVARRGPLTLESVSRLARG